MEEILDGVYVDVFFNEKDGKIKPLGRNVSVSVGSLMEVLHLNAHDITLCNKIEEYIGDITYDTDVYLAIYKTNTA